MWVEKAEMEETQHEKKEKKRRQTGFFLKGSSVKTNEIQHCQSRF